MLVFQTDKIDKLNLSNRATNALKRVNIYSVQELVEYPLENFLK